MELEVQGGWKGLSPLLGAFLEMPGAQCPVPLFRFAATQTSGDDKRSVFLIENFPDVREVRWQPEGAHGPIVLTVSASGRVVLPVVPVGLPANSAPAQRATPQ